MLYHLGLPGRYHGSSARGTAVSVEERLRLVQLVLTVLAQAAQRAEDECLRIMSGAEMKAAEIVQDAHNDVAHLSWWLQPSPATTAPGALVDNAPHPTEARIDPSVVDDRLPSGVQDDREADFFASFSADQAERWRFMDDGELVGVGATVRKLLRRPPRAREHPDE